MKNKQDEFDNDYNESVEDENEYEYSDDAALEEVNPDEGFYDEAGYEEVNPDEGFYDEAVQERAEALDKAEDMENDGGEYDIDTLRINSTAALIKKLMVVSLAFLITIFVVLNLVGYFNVRIIEFDYNPKISEKKMFNILNLDQGKVNIFKVNTKELEKKLMALKDVKNVSVKKHFPDQLDIVLNYNNVIGAVVYTNLYIVINEEGEVLDVNTRQDGLVRIEGARVNSFQKGKKIEVADNELFMKVVTLVAALKKSPIKEIKLVTMGQDGVNITIDSGFLVKMGRLTNLDKGFNNLVAIYDDLKKKKKSNGIIDVSSPDTPLWIPKK